MGVGRPTLYDSKMNRDVIKLCRLGVTDKEIADFFNVSAATLSSWKKNHPEFMESMREGKIESDFNVADSLYTEAISGNVRAAEVWLRNRRSNEWREKKDINLNVKGSLNAALEDDFGGDE